MQVGDPARCRTDTEHHEPAILHEMRNEVTTLLTRSEYDKKRPSRRGKSNKDVTRGTVRTSNRKK